MNSFNDLVNIYLTTTENNYIHSLIKDLALDATGFASLDDLLNSDMANDFMNYDQEYLEDLDQYDYEDFVYNDNVEKYIREIDIHLSMTDLSKYTDFMALYDDFVEETGYTGTELQFEQSLKRSSVFFEFVIDLIAPNRDF